MECEFSLRALVLVATLGSYQGLCWQGNAGNTYAASGTGFILGTRSDDSPPVFEFSYGQGVYPVVVESFVPDYLYVQTDVFATTTVTETSSTPLATFTSTIHPAQLLRTMVRLSISLATTNVMLTRAPKDGVARRYSLDNAAHGPSHKEHTGIKLIHIDYLSDGADFDYDLDRERSMRPPSWY